LNKDDYARAVIAEGQRRGITPRGIVIALATCLVESGLQMYANSKVPESLTLPHDAVGSDGLSVGLFQQQVKDTGNGWWWGDCATCMDPGKSAGLFYGRLAKLNYNGPNTPGSYAQAVQQSAFPDRYDQHMSEAQKIYDRLAGDEPAEQETAVGFTGDPVWLEDVLREALGDRLVVEGDWASRGTGGTMGDIWGVLIHHTGNDRETVAGIRDGRSDLSGPLSQCLITPDGKCHLIAVGPCNHAGIGSYPGIGTNNGNQRLIGFECAWPTIRADGSYDPGQRWPDAQIITMRDATAAVLKKLGVDSSHTIGHKEWATQPPNVKWDPGNMDMNWWRGEVAKAIARQFDTKPNTPPVVTPPPSPATPPANPDAGIWDQVCGRWEMLGWQTVVETLAQLRDAATGSKDAGKPGFTRGPRPAK
jgi:hypothetical protein